MTTLEINEIIRAGSPDDLALVLNEVDNISKVYCEANGHTILHDTVLTGEVEKVKVVLERKPDLEVRSRNQKFTPLHTAVVNDHVAVIEALLDAGANIKATAQDGLTSLHLATMRGHVNATSVLLRRGADIDETEVNGATAMHAAAFYGYTDVVRLLLEKGADPDRKDRGGLSPRILAQKKGHSAILSIMGGPGKASNKSLPEGRIKVSIYEMEAEFLKSQRVRALFEACRPAHGPIQLIDFEFENGVQLLNVRIEDEFLVTIPAEYASLPVKTASIPVRERQRALAPMTAKRKDGTVIF